MVINQAYGNFIARVIELYQASFIIGLLTSVTKNFIGNISLS